MIGFPIGLLAANAAEWVIHKHILHGRKLGKKRGSYWSFHFFEHHRNSRKNNMEDDDYNRSPFAMNAQGKEAIGLAGIAVIHLPLLPIAPFYTSAILYSIGRYYRVHKKSHQDPAWAREHLTWHYDHHMGPNQDCNWCVSKPWFDHVMGTRVPYAGTEREKKDIARRNRVAAEKRAKAA